MDHTGEAVGGPGPLSGIERRSSPRARSRIEASYEDVERHVFLHTVDVSEGGVFLVSPSSPPIGANAVVLLELPGDPTILRLRGQVARHQTHPETGFAVRFDPGANADDARRALRRFVEGTRSHPAAPDS